MFNCTCFFMNVFHAVDVVYSMIQQSLKFLSFFFCCVGASRIWDMVSKNTCSDKQKQFIIIIFFWRIKGYNANQGCSSGELISLHNYLHDHNETFLSDCEYYYY